MNLLPCVRCGGTPTMNMTVPLEHGGYWYGCTCGRQAPWCEATAHRAVELWNERQIKLGAAKRQQVPQTERT